MEKDKKKEGLGLYLLQVSELLYERWILVFLSSKTMSKQDHQEKQNIPVSCVHWENWLKRGDVETQWKIRTSFFFCSMASVEEKLAVLSPYPREVRLLPTVSPFKLDRVEIILPAGN